MPSVTTAFQLDQAIASEALAGLTASPKTLPPWLFYDETGSSLFEEITTLPEYYLTRTERGILSDHAQQMLGTLSSRLTIVELGAGTASKTGIVLQAASRLQDNLLYQPIDVSPSALAEAQLLERSIPGVHVRPQVANYITEAISVERAPGTNILALYIGSSVGNFSPAEARGILRNLCAQLQPGDALLLGTDLAPGRIKSIATLRAAYDDAAGTTAAFNRNILVRLNRDLGADFRPECFAHKAIWNGGESRIEMHLQSLTAQRVAIPTDTGKLFINFAAGETIHTENSYKFTDATIASLLRDSGFALMQSWRDPDDLFAVSLAEVRNTRG